jgi:hypothetical protein
LLTTRSGPVGSTRNTRNVEITTTNGATAKTRRSAFAGITSSFWMNLMPSPKSWNHPWNPPGSIGPSRLCMWAIIFSRNVYPRMMAPSGMIASTTIVLIARIVPQPPGTSSASRLTGRCPPG